MIATSFVLGFAVGGCVILAAACWLLWRQNNDLHQRLREQQDWLSRLDEQFDRLSLEIFSIRHQQHKGTQPTEEEMKKVERDLLHILEQLMTSPVEKAA